jgi:hypothetical protein
MGKKTKEHRKKVAARNLKIKAEQSAMQKFMNESMKRQLEDLKKRYEAESGTTQNPA